MDTYNIGGGNYTTTTTTTTSDSNNKTKNNITETTRGPSWGPPNTRSVRLGDVNPLGSHGDGRFLAFSTFVAMWQVEVRS